MPSRLSPLVVAAVSAAAADNDDGDVDGGGGGGDDNDDDNDNDDNYDDDDGALAPDRPSMAKPAMWTTSLAHHDIHQKTLTLLICHHPAPVNRGLQSIVEKKQQKTKTLTDDCSALYRTRERGLTCLESGRRAASNEPSCFSRR